IGSQNIRFLVAFWMLLCWVFGAGAAEKWDAKTTARVNLRRNPSSNGVILSIVPKGHRVRIIEKQGLWSKIDVEGDIHGKGWVYAEYLSEILSKVPVAEINLQTVAVEMPSGEPIERIHSSNPSPNVQISDKEQTFMHTIPPDKALRNDVSAQPSMIEEIPTGEDKSEEQSRLKITTVGEPPQIVPVQASPGIQTEDEKEKPIVTIKSEKIPITDSKRHLSTQNELQDMRPNSTAVPPLERSIVGKAVHVAPMQSPQAGIDSHPPGVIQTASSGIPNHGNSTGRHTDIPVEKKEPVTAGQALPLELKKRVVPNRPAFEESAMQRMTVSQKRKGPTANQESMGLVELALKLTSIILTGIVVIYLHRANRIAARHYESLMQFQNRSGSS
ncbi:MAG: SH3 domain-containing protein, partial [Desulfobacterales bacterium]